MARGGPRKGAGRRKGQVSEPTKRRIEVAEKALAEGLNPLDYMLSILRDESQPMKERFAAAKEAAPYVHPRLAAVEHSGNAEKPLSISVVSGVIREDADEHVNGDTVNH